MLLVDVPPESRLQEDDDEPCVRCPALAHALDSNDSKDVASYPAAHATSTLNSAAFSSVVVTTYPVVSLGSVQMTSSHPLMVSSAPSASHVTSGPACGLTALSPHWQRRLLDAYPTDAEQLELDDE